MSALRSAPRGDRLIGWRVWAVGLIAAWAGPAAAGLAGLAAGVAAGRLGLAEGALAMLGASAWLLVISPLLSWLWLGLMLPFLWLWLRLGLGGWLNLAATGAAAGSMGAGLIDGLPGEAGMVLGAAGALIQRQVWGWMAPAALVPPPPSLRP